MAEIVGIEELSKNLKLVKIKDRYLPLAKPGQFFIMQYSEKPERLPLFIMDTNKEDNTATFLLYNQDDFSKELYSNIKLKDKPHYIEGPAGKGIEMFENKRILFVSIKSGFGGIYNVAKYLKEKNHIDIAFVNTEAFNTNHVRNFLNIFESVYEYDSIETFNKNNKTYDLVIAAGSIELLHKLVSVYQDTIVIGAVITRMLCTVGLCLSCRVNYDGKIKLPCVEGPWLDVTKIDFEDIYKRHRILKEVLVNSLKG